MTNHVSKFNHRISYRRDVLICPLPKRGCIDIAYVIVTIVTLAAAIIRELVAVELY